MNNKQIIFRQLIDDTSKTYTYLIADTASNKAIIVDPCLDQLNCYLQLLSELGLQLIYSIETHVHADHITAAAELRKHTHCKICVPVNADIIGADHEVCDNEKMNVDAIHIQAIATPGHVVAHMCYLINNKYLLSGDCLMIRGCGRTDFQEGDAATLFHSIKQKLFCLPDETVVYPGHDYHGCTCSSIYEEKQFNPRLANKSLAEFIEIMENLDLAMPDKIDVAVPANLKCGDSK